MTHEEIAAAYLTIPNALLRALGGANYLRDKVGATRFEVLNPWPSLSGLPFGLEISISI